MASAFIAKDASHTGRGLLILAALAQGLSDEYVLHALQVLKRSVGCGCLRFVRDTWLVGTDELAMPASRTPVCWQHAQARLAIKVLCTQALTRNDTSLDLEVAIAQAAQLQPVKVPREIQEGVLEFIVRRLEQLLVDEGCGIEAVKAVLSERGANPSIIAQSARELQVRCVLRK